ncbi:hypothetical protein V6D92_09420, partial [Enterobacter hormaechei]
MLSERFGLLRMVFWLPAKQHLPLFVKPMIASAIGLEMSSSIYALSMQRRKRFIPGNSVSSLEVDGGERMQWQVLRAQQALTWFLQLLQFDSWHHVMRTVHAKCCCG